MLTSLLAKLKLHAPPTTLVVAILAWIFGNKVDGQTLQHVGEIVSLVLGGSALPAAGNAASSAATAAKAKLATKAAGK